MKILLNKLNKDWTKLQNTIAKFEIILKDKIIFDFFITEVSGDGFCICNINNDELVSIENCINIILKDGLLTEENHHNNRI